MNHFEGRLATHSHYFNSPEDAEDFLAVHPYAVAFVMKDGILVSTIFGAEFK